MNMAKDDGDDRAIGQTLTGWTIAIPETRELDVFAGLLERRGAVTLRCPLISILDTPEPAAVVDWAEDFIARATDIVLLTGEGLRRILGILERHDTVLGSGLQPRFVMALGRVRRTTRGPKPAKVLRSLGLLPNISPAIATTPGVVEALSVHDWAGRVVGVQLYGGQPNPALKEFLEAGGAEVCEVAPYIYADAADDARVDGLLAKLAGGAVDVIAFTSKSQVTRLAARAKLGGQALAVALARTRVAVVGPVVADELAVHGVPVATMPAGDGYFMKPLTRALERLKATA